MFVASERSLRIASAAARARLLNLLRGDALSHASNAAYQRGLEAVIRVGPLGDLPGASKLVRVRLLDPLDRGAATTVGLRWEATGPASSLFPVFDADIIVEPDGEDRTRLAIAGAYRAPLGRLGAGLDRAILHRVADATIRALLADISTALTSPAPATEGRGRAAPGHSPAAEAARP
jgi:hypothetical protein